MNATRFLLGLLLCLLPSLVLAGTAHYVDCSAGTNGNGSHASPWNNIPSVNSHSFSTGDDVYFLVNTICTLAADSDRLQVDWSGTSGDRVIIGCYDGNGDFDCGAIPLVDGNRAIIDGNSDGNTANGGEYPSNWKGALEVKGQSYVTVQDIKFQYTGLAGGAGTGGIVVGGSNPGQECDHINLDNTYLYRSAGNSIGYFRTDTGTISNNRIIYNGYPNYIGTGAAMEVSALASRNQMDKVGSLRNITITGNMVSDSKNEGIGLYKGCSNVIVEKNIVYNVITAHISIGPSNHVTVRYNLVYNFPGHIGNTRGTGIASGIGATIGLVNAAGESGKYAGGYNRIYGNLVAGMARGISHGCEISCCHYGSNLCPGEDSRCQRFDIANHDFTSSHCHEDTYVYNNTLVDNEYNFRWWSNNSPDNDIVVKNNISWTITAGTVHSDRYSPAGVTWSHNLFDDSVGGNAATNAVIGDPQLLKTSGWQSLSADSLDGTEFKSTIDSPAIDAGTPISGYDDRIHAADFTAEPIIVSTAVDAVPDIGAWMYAVPVTCADLGGVDCCTGSQTCPGTDLGASSDCADVCCSEMCTAPTCQGQGYQCCDACGSGAHPQYDGDCPEQVCCEACEVCSDGTCNGSETCQSCPQDCGQCCGNTTCEAGYGENCSSCPSDCPTGAGEVCCSGVIYTGDCCEDGDCTAPDTCVGHACTPACNDGDSRACYEGPAGTEGIGVCRGGTRTCSGGAWGDCAGQVLPSAEVCDDTVDNDCNGLVDGADPECVSCSADVDCNDGDLCNGEESCSAGACQSGTPLDCDDGDPCTKDLCVPATGCEHTPDTSEECADYEPEGSCGCDALYRPGSSQGGFGGEAGLGLLLLFMLAFALRHRRSRSRSKMPCSF